MARKICISFPILNCSPISHTLTHIPAIKLQGYCYMPQKKGDEDANTILYYPQKQSCWLYYNSFMPMITVESKPCSLGLELHIKGRLTKTVHLFLTFSCLVLGLLQCYLIKTYLDGFLLNQFAGLIPIIILAFILILSSTALKYVEACFAREYRKQIEGFISSYQGDSSLSSSELLVE